MDILGVTELMQQTPNYDIINGQSWLVAAQALEGMLCFDTLFLSLHMGPINRGETIKCA